MPKFLEAHAMFKSDENEDFEKLFRTFWSFVTTNHSIKMQHKPVKTGRHGGSDPMEIDAMGKDGKGQAQGECFNLR